MMAIKNEIRQSSVIYSVGPGALSVLQDGTVVLVPGIDSWYVDRRQNRQDIPEDVLIQDKNLARELKVEIFVPPPAENISADGDFSSLPVMMFPKWVTCYDCGRLERLGETSTSRPFCETCKAKTNRRKRLVQVNFVTACECGHLDEFPWVEWVHRGAHIECSSNPVLTFTAKSAVQLRDQIVRCNCGARRSLAETTDPDSFGSGLGFPGGTYTCTKKRPWLRDTDTQLCTGQPRMVLRNSNNLYYSSVTSSILVPLQSEAPAEVLRLVRDNPRAPRYKARYIRWRDFDRLLDWVLVDDPDYYADCSQSDLKQALIDFVGVGEVEETEQSTETGTEFFARDEEWRALQTEQEDPFLIVRAHSMANVPPGLGIERIFAIPRLKVTTALMGFSRIEPTPPDLPRGKSLLRREPFLRQANWLPAVQHTGEGLFLAFSEEFIREWESIPDVQRRVSVIRTNMTASGRQVPRVDVNARFLLLHTIAHLLIQELILECGYTSAALSERIYSGSEQAGVLIFTSSSDADGTMGGLVGMSRPERILPALQRAVARAAWCSNDPVCMESGSVGQGNFGLNLAACHSCALLPETACEFFNQGLDRAVIVGDLLNHFKNIGFLDSPSF